MVNRFERESLLLSGIQIEDGIDTAQTLAHLQP
jgi:hypothetical protein